MPDIPNLGAVTSLADANLLIAHDGINAKRITALNTKTYFLTALANPTNAQDAATKAYVDAVASGLDVKQSVRVATSANITLSGTQTIDGVAVIAGDRVLVKAQTTASANGIYAVAAGAWSRSTDADTSAKVTAGMFTFIEVGTALAATGWVLATPNPITLNTTALTFTQFSGAGGGISASTVTAKGDLLAATAAATVTRLGVGANNQVLVADSTQATGVRWLASPTAFAGAVGVEAATYSAVPNTGTDQASNLQAAINAAAAATVKVLHIPAGVYLIGSVLEYPGGVTITGDALDDHWDVRSDVTVIRNMTTRTNGNTFMMQPAGGSGGTGAVIQRITFDHRGDFFDRAADSTTEWTLSVQSTTNVVIKECGFRNVRTMAIYSDCLSASPVAGIQVLRNHIYEAGGDGISFFGRLTNALIDGNTVENCQDDAIALQNHATNPSADIPLTCTVSNNRVLNSNTQTSYGSTPAGIRIFGASDIDVLHNFVERTYSCGIMVQSGAGATAYRSNNVRVRDNVVIRAGSGNKTSGPSASGTPAYGIFILDSDTVTGTNNRVTDSMVLDGNGYPINYFVSGCTATTGFPAP